MSMDTNLAGRLRNTSLPYSHGLAPLFEAVVNSIHAMDEAGLSTSEGRIVVEIVRDSQSSLELQDKRPGPDAVPNIISFKVSDNGIGFNELNMKSFMTLDSEHKADIGGRGVGRLLWLKAFDSVNVSSTFANEEGEYESRTFLFDRSSGVSNDHVKPAPETESSSTTVQLNNFKSRYREATHKTTRTIAKNILEHCLWYYVRPGGAPTISVLDKEDQIELDALYEEMVYGKIETSNISIKEEQFELTHVQLRTNVSKNHLVAYGANDRLVKEESLRGKIPGLFGHLHDGDGDFTYACYVSSSFLDDRVRSERTEFDIAENSLGLLEETEISLSDIRTGVYAEITDHMKEYLEENKRLGKARVEEFVSTRAPRYRPILKHISDDDLTVDPEMSDKELDTTLHRHLSDIESKMLEDGHDIMHPKKEENFPDYKKRVSDYLKRAGDRRGPRI